MAPTSRRQLLSWVGLGFLAPTLAQAQIVADPSQPQPNVTVVLFLRGGMDGLHAVVPYREDAYHRSRPGLRMGAPNDLTVSQADRVIDLDGFFGLHPAFSPLMEFWSSGRLAIHHGVGSDDRTRSHFEAMAAMERGVSTARDRSQGGWLARYLQATATQGTHSLRSVAVGSALPLSLHGAPGVVAMEDPRTFGLTGGQEKGGWEAELRRLYRSGNDEMASAGRDTLRLLNSLQKLELEKEREGTSELNRTLRSLAELIRAPLGIEIATVEKGGWDTHVGQGVGGGYFANQAADVAESIRDFYRALGADGKRVTLVVQTEFGRRLEENAGLGTDHGRASVMFVIGEGMGRNKVVCDWKGLGKDQLEEGLDLPVLTDYRSVLSGVLKQKGKPFEVSDVFPDWLS